MTPMSSPNTDDDLGARLRRLAALEAQLAATEQALHDRLAALAPRAPDDSLSPAVGALRAALDARDRAAERRADAADRCAHALGQALGALGPPDAALQARLVRALADEIGELSPAELASVVGRALGGAPSPHPARVASTRRADVEQESALLAALAADLDAEPTPSPSVTTEAPPPPEPLPASAPTPPVEPPMRAAEPPTTTATPPALVGQGTAVGPDFAALGAAIEAAAGPPSASDVDDEPAADDLDAWGEGEWDDEAPDMAYLAAALEALPDDAATPRMPGAPDLTREQIDEALEALGHGSVGAEVAAAMAATERDAARPDAAQPTAPTADPAPPALEPDAEPALPPSDDPDPERPPADLDDVVATDHSIRFEAGGGEDDLPAALEAALEPDGDALAALASTPAPSAADPVPVDDVPTPTDEPTPIPLDATPAPASAGPEPHVEEDSDLSDWLAEVGEAPDDGLSADAISALIGEALEAAEPVPAPVPAPAPSPDDALSDAIDRALGGDDDDPFAALHAVVDDDPLGELFAAASVPPPPDGPPTPRSLDEALAAALDADGGPHEGAHAGPTPDASLDASFEEMFAQLEHAAATLEAEARGADDTPDPWLEVEAELARATPRPRRAAAPSAPAAMAELRHLSAELLDEVRARLQALSGGAGAGFAAIPGYDAAARDGGAEFGDSLGVPEVLDAELDDAFDALEQPSLAGTTQAAARFAALAAVEGEVPDPWAQLDIHGGRLGPLPRVAPRPVAEVAEEDVEPLATDAPRAPAERALAERPPRAQLAVKVGLEHGNNFFTGFSGNISNGGLFVATHQTLPIGSQVELFFEMPDGHAIATLAEVRWVREYNPMAEDAPPGMGFCFVNLRHDDNVLIERYIDRHETIFFDD